MFKKLLITLVALTGMAFGQSAVHTPTLEGTYHWPGTDSWAFGNFSLTGNLPQCGSGTVMTGFQADLTPNCVATGSGVIPSLPEFSIQAYGSGGTLTSDSSITINPTTHTLTSPNVTTGNVVSGGPIIDVRYYGAVVNGTTDDTTAINNALTAASSVNGTILIPNGMSVLSSQITVPSNVSIQCQGQSSGFISTATTNAFYFAPGTGNSRISNCAINGSSTVKQHVDMDIGVSNVVLDHNWFTGGGTGGFGQITLSQVHDIWITDNQLLGGTGTYGIVANNNSSYNPTTGAGVFQAPLRIHIRGNKITSSGSEQLSIACFGCRYSDVIGNYIDEGNGIAGPPYTEGGYGVAMYAEPDGQADSLPTPTSVSGTTGTIVLTFPVPSSLASSYLPEVNDIVPVSIAATSGGTSTNVTVLGQVTSATQLSFTAPAGSNYTGVNFAATLSVTVNCSLNLCTVTAPAGNLPQVSSPSSPIYGGGNPVGFSTTISGVTGTGTINTFIQFASIISTTQFTYSCTGCSTSGSVAGAMTPSVTLNVVPTGCHVDNNTIRNAAGNGVYLQTAHNCTVNDNVFENVMQKEESGSLLEGAVSFNTGDNNIATGNTIRGSGGSCYDLENTRSAVVSGGTCTNFADYGVKLGSGDINFSVGGGLSIYGGSQDIFIPSASVVPANSGKIDSLYGYLPTGTGISIGTGGLVIPFDIEISNITIKTATAIDGFLDDGIRTHFTNVSCLGCIFQEQGTNPLISGLKSTGLSVNAGLVLSGTTGAHITDYNPNGDFEGISLQGQNSDVTVEGMKAVALTGNGIIDNSPAPATGTLTSGSPTLSSLSTCGGFGVGDFVTDVTTPSNIPAGTTITSTCTSGSATMSANAAGNATGDTIDFYTSPTTGLKLRNIEINGAGSTVSQCILFHAVQNLDAQNVSCAGYSTSADASINWTGVSNHGVIRGLNVNGQNQGIVVSGQAANLLAEHNTLTSNTSFAILDNSSGTGNIYRLNTITGNVSTQVSVSNSNSVLYQNFTGLSYFITGAPASTCGPVAYGEVQYQSDAVFGRNLWICGPGGWTQNSGGVLTGTSASLGGSSVASGVCISNTTTVTNAATSASASASPNTYPGDGFNWTAYVSAANTVTLKECNFTAGSLTPTASTFNIRVIQ